MKKILVLFTSIFSILNYSYVEKNLNVYSAQMKKNVPVTVILPDNYNEDIKYPTIYTLHGWSGSNRNFPEKTPVGELADNYNIIFVSPDGNYDSWYVDSNVKKDSKYETFISKELIKYIDTNFSTDPRNVKRAITGLSMGGFGAFYIGVNNQDVFGNIGSMSGGVNVEDYKYNWGINNVINDYSKYNIKNLAHLFIFKKTNIIFDIGVDDFFIEANRELHKKLLDLNIKHDYIERPGSHNWDYWKNSIKYQTLFFSMNFEKNK